MPPLRPPPESPEDKAIQLAEGLFCHDRGVVLRPPLQYRVQLADQRVLRQCSAAFDDLTHFPIERRDVLLRGLDQQLGIPIRRFRHVLPEIPPQKIEALVDVRDLRFLP